MLQRQTVVVDLSSKPLRRNGIKMLVGKLVTLRALTDADMPRLTEFRNDVELELIGGGDPPRPCTLEVVREFFAERAKDREAQNFAIEADGKFIGDCGVFNPDRRGGTAEVGIGIGDRDYWGRGYGRDALRCCATTASGCRASAGCG